MLNFLAVSPDDILRGGPGRVIPTYLVQSSKPVTYWFSKTCEHIKVESKLERTRLMLLDFDPAVARVKSQPFLVEGSHLGKSIKHVPDFFAQLVTEKCQLINVKHIKKASDEMTIRTAGFVQELAALRGWESEMWTGEDVPPARIHNIRGLAGFRNPDWFDPHYIDRARQLSATTLIEAEQEVADTDDQVLIRGAIMHLLWKQEWTIDYSVPLLATTPLQR